MHLFNQTNIDFIGKRKFFFVLSAVIVFGGLIAALISGIDYGIDFVGGNEIAVEFKSDVSTSDIRTSLDKTFVGSEIKSYGKPRQFLIRVKESAETSTQSAATNVMNILKQTFPNNESKAIKVDKIGPKVGAELRRQAFYAVLLSSIFVLLYIAFRFEFIYGMGAVIALVHDVLVAFALVVLGNKLHIINLEMNQSMIAAFLTVIGFSTNDTVIIFDRIRENKEKHKAMPIIPLMNLSINEALSRTIITVLTVVFVLLTMLLMGGEVLQGFSFAMLIGIITGTYSSIYIASSFVVWYLEKVKKVRVDDIAHGEVFKAAKI